MLKTVARALVGASMFLAIAIAPAAAQTGGAYVTGAPEALLAPGAVGGPGHAKFELNGGRVYHGASLPNTWDPSGLQGQYQQYQGYAGKKLAVMTWFASVYENSRITSWRQQYIGQLRHVKQDGSLSLVKFSTQDYAYPSTHKIADLKYISAGAYDAYFVEMADTMRDFGDPIFLSIDHEMNGTWYPYSQAFPGSQTTAADFVSAWRHIVDIFRKEGANNVAFVWSPNVPDVGGVSMDSYYPGDDYVDWVGCSFYSGNPISNLNTIYRTYADRKPIFITEWATGVEKSRYYPGFPGDAQWVDSFFKALGANYPRVKGISWFQWNKDDGNYLLQRVPDQAQVYSADIQNPRYADSANDLLKPAPATYTPPAEVVPNEIVLNEPVQTQTVQAENAPVENAPAEQPKPRLHLTLGH